MGIAMMSGGERLARFIERSSAARTEFLNLARAADVGISDVAAEYIEDPRASEQAVMLVEETAELQRELARSEPSEQEDLKQRLAQAQSRAILLRERSRRVKLLLRHSNTWFELGDESEGTRLWLYCLPDVITGLEVGRTLVIDEIDSSLHPLLVRKLVELFRNPDLNVGGAQLVFTTHDPFLLAPVAGEPGVERDQVWFVEKQPDGTSELYPLTDFKPRNEHNLARRYLGGAYGAIPILDGFELLRAPVTAE
jgi:AAA15 family ATPase/GTPase